MGYHTAKSIKIQPMGCAHDFHIYVTVGCCPTISRHQEATEAGHLEDPFGQTAHVPILCAAEVVHSLAELVLLAAQPWCPQLGLLSNA